MKQDLKRFADKYVKAIEDENAAVFAGAGLSVGSGFVNWKELLRSIAEELNLDVDREHDLVALAQYYDNEKGGRGSINSQLVSEFTKNVQASENHKILASLPIKTYWTTNYDKLIENTLMEYGKLVDTKISPTNIATNIPKRDAIVYKMHGDISLPNEAVITKEDYENYNESRQVFTTALQGDLITKTFLFIGFSFEDPNLEYILSRIRVLLGNSGPDHYCFLKRVNEADFKDNSEFIYEKTKQELKIKDLKRYRIQSLLVDDFSEITNVLNLIKSKLKRRRIFISGAAHSYGEWNQSRAENLIFNLSKRLAESEYKIISGFGVGIGSSVINGTLSHVYSKRKKHIEDYLILRPFPQNIIDSVERDKLWNSYREDMISEAGIAIFFFGNKLSQGQVVDSDGLYKEFEISINQGVKVIPIGCTGFVSRQLWERVINSIEEYYPNNSELYDLINSLGEHMDDSLLIDKILKVISILQNNI